MSKPSRAANNPRVAAARCLAAVVGEGASLSQQLPLQEKHLDPQQRPLLRELCYGTLRHYWRLDAALKPLFKKPFKAKDQDIQLLIYLGAYQLFYTRIPSHAAINSSVEAARELGKPWAAGMINALLRRCQRDGETRFDGLTPAAASAHPQWLYQALATAWPKQLQSILAANNQHPPMCLRVNQRQGSRQAYLQKLSAVGIEAAACDYAPQGIRLVQPCGVDKLPDFAQGAASVQDEAAQLCSSLLDLQPGQRVLDACAAPGGKSGAILEAQPALAELVALDIDAQRLQRVNDNLQRLSLTATLLAADAANPQQWWDQQLFDRILLDAPCSASGVLRRNPDIKLHRRETDIAALAALQLRLLTQLWPLLKPGGIVLYATCSILPQENDACIARFIDHQADAHVLPIDGDWGLATSLGRQLLPSSDGPDGFYYARLQRR